MARTTPGGRFGKRTKATKPVESSAEGRNDPSEQQEDAIASPSREPAAGDASGTAAMDDPFVVTPSKKRTRAEAAAAPDAQENGDDEEDAAEEKEVVASLLPRASPAKRQTRSAPAAERDPAFVTPTKPRSTRTSRRPDTAAGLAASPTASSSAGTPHSATRRAAREADSYALPTPPATPTISISPSPSLASASASAVRDIDIGEDDDALLPPTPTSASGRRNSLASTSTSSSAAETPVSPAVHSSSNVYARARALLRLSADVAATSASSAERPVHSISSDDLVGRNVEKEQLLDFLNANLPSLFQQGDRAGNGIEHEYTASADKSAVGDTDGAALSATPAHRPKAMYISGSPGTGKTALLSHVLERLQAQQAGQSPASSAKGKGRAVPGMAAQTKTAFLNCASIAVGRKKEIWTRLADALGFDASLLKGKTEHAGQQVFERLLQQSGNSRCLVVLDEIDHLLTMASTNTSQANVLSRLFGLALNPNSNLVLIGIANALDLTSRHLQLELLSATPSGGDADMVTDGEMEEVAATSRQPELLHFRPFQAEEMVAIAKARLSCLHASVPSEPDNAVRAPTLVDHRTSTTPSSLPIFMPAALDFAAKKVAAVTGDLRSFLSLIRKAVELFEAEERKRFSSSDSPAQVPSADNKSSPASSSMSRRNSQPGRDRAQVDCLDHFTAATAPKLTPAHILKATRLVTLSPAASSGASPTAGNASSGSALSMASNSALLEAKIADLNLQQRLALTAFVICIWQRQAAAALPSWALAAASSPTATTLGTGDGVKPADLHSGYRTLLEKEDMIHPVGSNEFSDLLSGLHTRGLVGLEREVPFGGTSGSSGMGSLSAPPMLRRTSSSSSAGGGGSSRSPRGSRSPSPSAAHAPLALLYAPAELAQALRSTRPTEAAGMCTRILAKEERRLQRWRTNLERAQVERDEKRLAPSEGFAGDGLDGVSGLVGSRDRRGAGRDADMDELEQEGENSLARENHERLLLGDAAGADRDA